MSIFDGAGSQTSEAELADLAKANPDLTAEPAPAPAAEPEPVRETESAAEQKPVPVTEAAEPEKAAEPDEQTEPERGPVDYKALKAERERRRALETQLAEFKGKLEAMERVWQPPQQQAQQPPPPPQEPIPDPEQDPIGALKYFQKQNAQLQQHVQAQAIQQRVQQDYVADAQRFAAQTPDFAAAYQHLFAGRVAELKAQGWQDQQIRQQVQQEEFNIALGALRAGRSPAQQAYELAKARGYAPAQAKPAAAAPRAVDPALQEARQKAAVSLSEGGKPEKGGELTLEDISQLRGAAQESALKKYEERNHKRPSIFRE